MSDLEAVVRKKTAGFEKGTLTWLRRLRSKEWFKKIEKFSGVESHGEEKPLPNGLSRRELIPCCSEACVAAFDQSLVDIGEVLIENKLRLKYKNEEDAAKINLLKDSEDVEDFFVKVQKAKGDIKDAEDELAVLDKETEFLKNCLEKLKDMTEILVPYCDSLQEPQNIDQFLEKLQNPVENEPKPAINEDFFDVLKEIEAENNRQVNSDTCADEDLKMERTGDNKAEYADVCRLKTTILSKQCDLATNFIDNIFNEATDQNASCI
ncbi:unnamed protein product [Bursaphelenchus okinawaensis]|uniref:Uncharacterized protein n=1 Tax=Bursaphelenchus okinawaensis TaxID=465554 RepID=A0A811JVJ2_9BILA|nr:unnamed protein product [Bursaphelenchus okinawaensis]CAG9085940.1 unnamed protein product [Bursaphelenchus okinawaensis]